MEARPPYGTSPRRRPQSAAMGHSVATPRDFRNAGQGRASNWDPTCAIGGHSRFRNSPPDSKFNGKLHNWNRMDTFQAPTGHLGDLEDVASRGQAHAEGGSQSSQRLCCFQAEWLGVLHKEVVSSVARLFAEELSRLREHLDDKVAELAKEMRVALDDTTLLWDIKQQKAEMDLAEVQTKIEGLKAQDDVCSDIRQQKMTADIAEVMAKLDGLNMQADLCSDIRQQKMAADIAEVMAKIDGLNVQADVCRDIRQQKAEVDLTEVLAKIDGLSPQGDFTAVLKEVRAQTTHLTRIQVKIAQVLSKIDGALTVDAVQPSAAAPQCEQQPSAQFGALFEELRGQRANLAEALATSADGLYQQLAAKIDCRDLEADVGKFVSAALRETQVNVDLSALTETIHSLDFSPVLTAISDQSTHLAQVLEANIDGLSQQIATAAHPGPAAAAPPPA